MPSYPSNDIIWYIKLKLIQMQLNLMKIIHNVHIFIIQLTLIQDRGSPGLLCVPLVAIVIT